LSCPCFSPIVAAILGVSPSARRVSVADNSFAFFPLVAFVRFRLAGEKLARREIAERDQERAYFR
jgi:hypothetical protein